MDLKEGEILREEIDGHWYYLSKGRALQKFLGHLKVPEVLDVGAGSGIFSRQLLAEGRCDSAVCLDVNYDSEGIENYRGKTISFVKDLRPPFLQKLIIMMDVLEHIQDDGAFLKHYVDNLSRGGYVLITVPAFQFLWSGHDVFLEHHRRYTIKTVEAVAKASGLTPIKSRYYFGILFPVIAAVRIFRKILFRKSLIQAKSDLKEYPKWVNRLLILFHDLEKQVLFPINKAFGLSVFCLCKKS